MHRYWVRSLVTLLALSFAAPAANAYVWYTAESGEPMRWFRPEVTVKVSTVAPKEVDWDVMHSIVEESFTSWVDLPGCRLPQVDVVGTTDARTITTPESLDDEPDNIIVFITSNTRWHALPGATGTQIALTFISHNPDTGEIVDADIAVNNATYHFTTEDDATTGVDLKAAVTHEMGHFFGMGHSLDPSATMFANYGLDATKRTAARTLEQDDIDGVCNLYEDVPEWVDPNAPATGGGGGGGDCAAAGGGVPAPIAAAFVLLALGAFRRRRARSLSARTR